MKYEEIVAKINNRVSERALTVYRLTKMTGLSDNTIARLLAGENVNVSTLIKVCEVLGLELEVK